jgi:hypothetical protein
MLQNKLKQYMSMTFISFINNRSIVKMLMQQT